MSKFLLIFPWLVFGCCKPEVIYQTVYQEVLLPVRCSIAIPVKPAKSDNAVLQLIDFIHYTHELELAVRVCGGE